MVKLNIKTDFRQSNDKEEMEQFPTERGLLSWVPEATIFCTPGLLSNENVIFKQAQHQLHQNPEESTQARQGYKVFSASIPKSVLWVKFNNKQPHFLVYNQWDYSCRKYSILKDYTISFKDGSHMIFLDFHFFKLSNIHEQDETERWGGGGK